MLGIELVTDFENAWDAGKWVACPTIGLGNTLIDVDLVAFLPPAERLVLLLTSPDLAGRPCRIPDVPTQWRIEMLCLHMRRQKHQHCQTKCRETRGMKDVDERP